MPNLEELVQRIILLEKRVSVLEKQKSTFSLQERGKFFPKKTLFGFVISFFISVIGDDIGYFFDFYFLEDLGVLGMWIFGIVIGIQFLFWLFRGKTQEKISEKIPEENIENFLQKSPEPKKEEKKPFSLEDFFGKNLFPKMGVILSVIGVVLLVKYSFDNSWIGALGRVSLGMMAGIGFVGLGDYLSGKYKKYALTLMGGGFAMMYFSIFSARNFYETEIGLDPYVAFGILIFVTISATFLAHRHREQGFALFALGGGFATPFLVNGEGNIAGTLSYIFLLDIAVLFLAAHHQWKALSLGAFIASFLLSSGAFLLVAPPSLGVLFLAAFFLIFLGFSLVNILGKKENFSPILFSFSLLAPLFFFGQMMAFFEEYNLNAYQGIFTLGLAALYVLIGTFSFQKKSDLRIIESFFGAALVFIAVAIFFEANATWMPILWAAQGGLLFFLGQKNKWEIWKLGAVLMGIATLSYLPEIFDARSSMLLFNERVGIGAFLVALFGFLQWRFPSNALAVVLQSAVFLLPLCIGWAEITDFFETENYFLAEWEDISVIQMKIGLGHSLFLALYALFFFVLGWMRQVSAYRLAGIGVFLFAVLKVLLFDLWELGDLYRIFSVLFLAALLLGVGFLYHRYQEFFFSKK